MKQWDEVERWLIVNGKPLIIRMKLDSRKAQRLDPLQLHQTVLRPGMKQWDEVERWLIGRDVWLDTAMCATYGDPVQMRRMILSHDPQKHNR